MYARLTDVYFGKGGLLMIKSIVFDLGNVLIDFDPMRFVREKTTDPQKQKMLVSEIFGSGLAAL